MKLCGKAGKIFCVDSEIMGEHGALAHYILDFSHPAVVEPGPRSVSLSILKAIDEAGIEREAVKYVFVTHVHLDHGGGAGTLIKHLPGAKVICHPKAYRHLINPEKLWNASISALGPVAEIYEEPEPIPEKRVIAAEDGEVFDLGDDRMIAIHSPGHAPHHISFFLEKSRVLFPGDSAGVYGAGRAVPTTPPPFNLDDAIKSLEKMIRLEPEIIAYTHYGIAKNSKDLLNQVLDKTIKWSAIAMDVVREGGNTQELHEKLLRVDSVYAELLKIFSYSKIVSGFHQLTLLGLIDYARKEVLKKS